MIGQTIAIFVDAYRQLNAKKLFWIVMGISALVIGLFALLGVDGSKLTFATFELDLGEPVLMYKVIVNSVLINLWFTWGSIILALISTAGIFPDLISGGEIDLYLSKPIGRLRLFLTKYLTGLMFVFLQSIVFGLGLFVVMGLRIGEWNAGLLLIVPLTVCLFSYIFAVSVLVGVMTRSTIAAILLSIAFWAIFATINQAERIVLTFREMTAAQASFVSSNPNFTPPSRLRPNERPASAEELNASVRKLDTVHRIVYGVATVFPKTSETIAILDRPLLKNMDVDHPGAMYDPELVGQAQAIKKLRQRPVWWILGTSLLFEAVIVGWAAWIFCRRDY